MYFKIFIAVLLIVPSLFPSELDKEKWSIRSKV